MESRAHHLTRQKLIDDATESLFLEGFRDGREGRAPQKEDILYFNGWGQGFGQLAYEKWAGPGLVPSMEWRPRSPIMARHMEATDPNIGAEAERF